MNAIYRTAVAVILFWLLNDGSLAAPPEPLVLQGHTKSVSTLAWSADGNSIATASDDRTIRRWNKETGRQTAILSNIADEGYGGPVVSFTADLQIAAVNYWGKITLRTVPDGQTLVRIDPILDREQRSPFRPDVFAMAFRPDGKQLVTAGSVAAVGGPHGLPGGIVIVWDAETGKIVHQFKQLSTSASSVDWSADGALVAAGTSGAGGELQEAGEVHVWDARSGKQLHAFRVKPKTDYGEWASAADVAFAPDRKRIAVSVKAGSRGAPAGIIIGDTGGSVRIWDLETGKETQPANGLHGSIQRISFSPDGKRLATAGRDNVARVWDVATGSEQAVLKSSGRVSALAFSPDGRSLATGCIDGSVCIWSVSAE